MRERPKVVVGVPVFNGARHVAEALESLLSQTLRNMAFVVIDDGSTDESPEIVSYYADLDERLIHERNQRRLGMIGNWRRTYGLARQSFPDCKYFAWASDHDVWHPHWAEVLSSTLEQHADAVLAYPKNVGIDERGSVTRDPWKFDSAGVRSPRDRLSHVIEGMAAGNMVYGLFRADVVERCGVYRSVLLPDRLLLAEAAIHGQFIQVDEILWYRRFREGVRPSYARQRAAFFVNGAPAYTYLPWWSVHTGMLIRSLVIDRPGPMPVGRTAGLFLALRYLIASSSFSARRQARQMRKTVGRFRKRRMRLRNRRRKGR